MTQIGKVAARLGDGVLLAMALTALAGWVDAVGFLRLRGVFVSFMSGNSTIIGVATASGDWHALIVAASMVATFVTGVVIGEVMTQRFGQHRQMMLLMFEAVLFAVAACIAAEDASAAGRETGFFAPFLALAMGVQNASVGRDGKVKTFVTGTLADLGRAVAARMMGVRQPILPALAVWSSLVIGAAISAFVALQSNGLALTLASGFALFIAAWMASLSTGPPPQPKSNGDQ